MLAFGQRGGEPEIVGSNPTGPAILLILNQNVLRCPSLLLQEDLDRRASSDGEMTIDR
jgi:hypothetical protein